MASISEDQINHIREQVNIRELISQYIPLTQKGQNYWAVCPFHDDHNPSLSISESKQIYKCFVCGAGGNVFTFVRDYENISFVEAVVKVASQVGIDLSNHIPKNSIQVSKVTKRYWEIMSEAGKFYQYQLKNSPDSKVKEFLIQRHLQPEIIEEFSIGLARSNNQLTDFLIKKGYVLDDLVKLDLTRIQVEVPKDVFYERIVFPIHTEHGTIVAFTGRALYKENEIKYINTSGTPIYTKGDLLYNYNRINQRDLKKEPLILVEGVLDVIGFYRANIKKVVASLGTALTDSQIRLIKKTNSNVILAFDKDEAGQKATYQIGRVLIDNNIKVSVYNNQTNLDPDEYQKERGSAALLQTINSAQHWIEFVIGYGIKLYSLHSYQNRKDVTEFVLKHLSKVESFDQSYFINQLSEVTGFDSIELHNQLKFQTNDRPVTVNRTKRTKSVPKVKLLSSEKEILSFIVSSKQAAYYFRDNLGYLLHQDANDLALIILNEYNQHDSIEIADLLNKQLTSSQEAILLDIEISNYNRLDNYKEVLKDDMIHIQVATIDQQITQLALEAQNEQDNDRKLQISKQITELIVKKNEIKRQGEEI